MLESLTLTGWLGPLPVISWLGQLPLISDPWFYAVAIPAVLLTGLSKSGFATGFGSLATPLMALTLQAPQAAAIMLPLLLATDATGLQQLWRDRNAALVRHLLPWGVLGVTWAPLGVWAGVWLVRRVSSRWFYGPAYVGMFLTGTKLLWDGLK